MGQPGGRKLVVKSSTKKRLVELGVPEEHAHKLADDANMDAIKQMSVEQVAKKIGIETDSAELEKIMGIIREQGTRKRTRSRRITISQKALDDDDVPTGSDRFNVLNHDLVPHHELLPIDEEATSLEPWGLEVPEITGEGTTATCSSSDHWSDVPANVVGGSINSFSSCSIINPHRLF